MNSAKPSTPLDLEVGLRTRPEDVLALRRAKHRRPMSLEAYIAFLLQFQDPPVDVLRARRGPRGDRPFEL